MHRAFRAVSRCQPITNTIQAMEFQKVPTTYYATNLRALTLRECIRLGGGWLQGPLTWAIGRFVPAQGREKMPTDYDLIESEPNAMSEVLRERIELAAAEYREMGFSVIGWQRIDGATEGVIDSGSVICLSPCRTIVGLFSVVIKSDENTPTGFRYNEAMSLNVFQENGSGLCVADSKICLDPEPGSKVIFMVGKSPAEMLKRIQNEKRKNSASFVKFAGWPEVRRMLEFNDTKNFLHRRDKRRLFVEVEA